MRESRVKWVTVRMSINDIQKDIIIGFITQKEFNAFFKFVMTGYEHITVIKTFQKDVKDINHYSENSKGVYTISGREYKIINTFFEIREHSKPTAKPRKAKRSKPLSNFKREFTPTVKSHKVICKNENCLLNKKHECQSIYITTNKSFCDGRFKEQPKQRSLDYHDFNYSVV